MVATRSWPVTRGYRLALHELAEGTVLTDPLVAYFIFFDPKYWGKRSGAQGTKPGLTSSNKGHEAAHVTLPYGILERTQNIRCANLPLGGILEKCPKSSVCTYHNRDLERTQNT